MKDVFCRVISQSLRTCAAFALMVCAPFLVFAIYAAAASPAPTVDLNIAKFAFAPKEITVVPGTKIIWTNRDDTPHTVASDDKSFASKGLDTDDRFEHTFTSEGDFNYICTVHPFMTGVVHVRK
jgi:plastocyanin